MPKREKYVPKHRAPSAATIAKDAPKKVLRSTVVLSGLAVTATAGVVSAGVVASPLSVSQAADGLREVTPLPDAQLERAATVSRSDRREAADPAKEAALAEVAQSDGPAVTRSEDLSDADPREIGRALVAEFGYSADQFSCLDSLYVSESNWRVNADNPTSSAYGIPQALTETHDLPAGYMTSAEVQIRWGLHYIQDRYGSPCNAWGFKQGHGWY